MDRRADREFQILSAIAEGQLLTQRALAERLGVALGLANLYLARLVTKGYVKVTEFPRKPAARKRLRYLLTPKGIAEKTRLTYDFMGRSLAVYRQARETLRAALGPSLQDGGRRVALYGTGEAAELAYLTLRELGIEPVGIFDGQPRATFLGAAVRDVRELPGFEVDRVIVATFDRPKVHLPGLVALGIPADKLVFLQPTRRTNGSR